MNIILFCCCFFLSVCTLPVDNIPQIEELATLRSDDFSDHTNPQWNYDVLSNKWTFKYGAPGGGSHQLESNNIKLAYGVDYISLKLHQSTTSCDDVFPQTSLCDDSVSVTIMGRYPGSYAASSFKLLETQLKYTITTVDVSGGGRGLAEVKIIIDPGTTSVEVWGMELQTKFCQDDTTYNLVHFAKTYASEDDKDITGECVEHANWTPGSKKSVRHCSVADGWRDLEVSSCQCKAGFQYNDRKCTKCPEATYKPDAGNATCQRCALNEMSTDDRTRCECMSGYARTPTNHLDTSCYRLPRPPTKVWWRKSNSTSVQFKFNSTSNTDYLVECTSRSCDYATPSVQRSDFGGDMTVRVAGLRPSTLYVFRIYALNGLFPKHHSRFLEMQIKTLKSRRLTGLNYQRISDNQVMLSWNAAPWASPGHTVMYDVRVHSGEQMVRTHIVPNNTEFPILVNQDMTLGFSVGVLNDLETYSEILYYSQTGALTTAQIRGITVLIGVISLIFVSLLTTLCLVFCYYKRRKDLYLQQYGHSTLPHQLYKMDPGAHMLSDMHQISPMPYHTAKASGHFSIDNFYVDPSQYFDCFESLLLECSAEIPESCLSLENPLPTGQFGQHYDKGQLQMGKESAAELVTVRMLGDGCSEEEQRSFANQVLIMSQFRHPNVLLLHGVITKTHPLMLVVEHQDKGPLDFVLSQRSEGATSTTSLTHMLRGIASGMQYLHDSGRYVHKVLCSMNVEVSRTNMCKVGGFDMRATIDSPALIHSANPKNSSSSNLLAPSTHTQAIELQTLLTPWTAIELFEGASYSPASDIWAFGNVMWQVFTKGQKPFFEWSPKEILRMLYSGYRLPPPDGCPDSMYELMMLCWSPDPHQRPSFAYIRQCLEHAICSPAPTSPSECESFSEEGLDRWLGSLGLDGYRAQLEMAGFFKPSDLLRVDNLQLKNLGVKSGKDRRRLLDAVSSVKSSSLGTAGTLSTLTEHSNYTSVVHSII